MATRTETLVIRVNADGTREVTREIRRVATTAKNAADEMYYFRRALRSLGLFMVATEAVKLSDAYTTISNRLRYVTRDTVELKGVMQELFNVSQETRSGFQENAELFNRLNLSTRQLGLSQRDLLNITSTLNKSIILSGVTVREANNALIQLSQGLASGRLAGDELRSVLEQLPPVADIIATEMGTVRGELRKLGSEGKITTDVVISALQAAEERTAKAFENFNPTVSQAFTVLRNAALKWVGEAATAANANSMLANSIMFLAKHFDTVAKLALVAGAVILGGFAGGPVGAAIAGIVAGVALFSDKVQLASHRAATLRDLLFTIFGYIKNYVVKAFTQAWQTVTEFFSSMDTGFRDVEDFLRTMARYIDTGLAYLNAFFAAAVTTVQVFKPTVLDIIYSTINAFLEGMEYMINESLRFFVKLPERMAEFIKWGVEKSIELFKLLVNFLAELPDMAAAYFRKMGQQMAIYMISGINIVIAQLRKIPGVTIDFLTATQSGAVQVSQSFQQAGSAVSNFITTLNNGGNPVQLGRVMNNYSGAAKAAAGTITSSFNQALAAGLSRTPVSDFLDRAIADADYYAGMRNKSRAMEPVADLDKRDPRTFKPTPPGSTGGSGKSRTDRELEKLEKQRLKLAEIYAKMEQEYQLLMLSGLEKEKQQALFELENELRNADLNLSKEELATLRLKTVQLVEFKYVAEQVAQVSSTIKDAFKGFVSDIRQGVSLSQALANAMNKIADKVLDMSLDLLFDNFFPSAGRITASLGNSVTGIPASPNVVSHAGRAGFARGGLVSGPGTGTSDSIAARLSRGEFVVNAASTKANRGLLEMINNGGSLRGGQAKSQIVNINNYGSSEVTEERREQVGDTEMIDIAITDSFRRGAQDGALKGFGLQRPTRRR